MVDNQLETLQFTQGELRVLIGVLNQVNIKLGDAQILLPIAQKLISKIKEEPKKEEEKPNGKEQIAQK